MPSIELLYAIPITILIISGITAYYGKLNLFIAFMGVLGGLGIAWALADYTSMAIMPLTDVIWYGYAWGWNELVVLIHLITIFAMTGLAVINLYRTGGRTLWT